MKIYIAVRTVLYWVLAALVMAFVAKIEEIEVLRYFIGGLLIFYGVEEIIYTVFKSKKHYSLQSLFWNIIEVIIGITLICFVEGGESKVTYAVVCVGWAVWSIFREARELVEASEELKHSKLVALKVVAIINILESLTVIALSLTMIVEPGKHHALIHLYLLAVELFTKALFPIINYAAEQIAEKKAKAEIVGDIDEADTEEQTTEEQTTEDIVDEPENEDTTAI